MYLDGIFEMIDIIKNLFKTKKQKEAEEVARKYAEDALKAEQEAERFAKLSPKEQANEKKEPWVAVLETHVNPENPRNGFFELDWNEYFIAMLRQNGYTGANEEDLVDQWFNDLCREVGSEENVPDMNRRGSGYVNRALREDGRTEVS